MNLCPWPSRIAMGRTRVNKCEKMGKRKVRGDLWSVDDVSSLYDSIEEV